MLRERDHDSSCALLLGNSTDLLDSRAMKKRDRSMGCWIAILVVQHVTGSRLRFPGWRRDARPQPEPGAPTPRRGVPSQSRCPPQSRNACDLVQPTIAATRSAGDACRCCPCDPCRDPKPAATSRGDARSDAQCTHSRSLETPGGSPRRNRRSSSTRLPKNA